MVSDAMRITSRDMKKINDALEEVEENGAMIRRIFGEYNDDEFDVSWEVDSAVDAFSIFSSRWAIEILALSLIHI